MFNTSIRRYYDQTSLLVGSFVGSSVCSFKVKTVISLLKILQW